MRKNSKKRPSKITLAQEELWRRGVIAPLYLRPHQYKLYDLINQTTRDLVVPNISRRFGKSSVCVTYAIEQAIQSKQDIRYATAFLTDLENFIQPIFDSVLTKCPDEIRPQWFASKKIFRFPNGSTIKLIGLDKNPNGIRGNAIDLLIIDEAAFVANLEYLYRSIIVPATADRPFKLIFPSTPPVSPEHFWAKELVPKAKTRNTYIEQTLDDNTHLSQEEKDRLLDEVGGKSSPTAQREFYCKIIVDATRAIAPSFVADLHIKPVPATTSIKWQWVGDSGGVRDKTAIYRVGYDHDSRKVVVADEIWFPPHTPTPSIAEAFKKHAETDELILDCPGQVAVDLAALGLKVSLPQKDNFEAGLQLLNAELHNNRIQIAPHCTLLTTTLTSGLLTKNRNDFERSESLGHCDAVAALIYALRAVDRVTDLRPRPKKESVFAPPPPKNPILKAFGG
jgi:hypothetical protein